MAIKRAVDVAEIVKNRMESMMKTQVKYQDIKIATEKVQREDGESNVSSIEIVLKK
jgi:DNA-binding protein